MGCVSPAIPNAQSIYSLLLLGCQLVMVKVCCLFWDQLEDSLNILAIKIIFLEYNRKETRLLLRNNVVLMILKCACTY